MAKIDIRNKKTSVRNEKNERSKKQKSTPFSYQTSVRKKQKQTFVFQTIEIKKKNRILIRYS